MAKFYMTIFLISALIMSIYASWPKVCTKDKDCNIKGETTACAFPGNAKTVNSGYCAVIDSDGNKVHFIYPTDTTALIQVKLGKKFRLEQRTCNATCPYCILCSCISGVCK